MRFRMIFSILNIQGMKSFYYLITALLLLTAGVRAQDRMVQQSTMNSAVYNAQYMDRPPVFGPGEDSLSRLFFKRFSQWERLIGKAVENGDTAKYLRVNFSYLIDRDGTPYDGRFVSVTSTRYPRARAGKGIRYLSESREELQQAVKSMLSFVPQRWTPGLMSGRPVRSLREDYIQIWVGLSDPPM